MKFKSLFLFLILLLFFNQILAFKPKINKKRLYITSTIISSSLTASYFYANNAWWSDNKVDFHFDNGPDLKYALNVDKAGHFLGGLQAADMFCSSMNWIGLEKEKSLWYGAGFGTALQLAIEYKDAFSPYWGFSKWDLALGTAGALWPVGQYYVDFFKPINFKFSYYKRSNIYYELERQRGKNPNIFSWPDDYPNQTYWMTLNLSYFFDSYYIPNWLNIAVGFGLDDTQYLNINNTKVGGKNEFYIALDYDIPKLLKSWSSPSAKIIKHWLNYFHLPSPTIRLSPNFTFYPLFL